MLEERSRDGSCYVFLSTIKVAVQQHLEHSDYQTRLTMPKGLKVFTAWLMKLSLLPDILLTARHVQ